MMKLAGVNGEGVQDVHKENYKRHKLNTTSEFEKFPFSIQQYPPSTAWTKFLRSSLPATNGELVLTHGDIRPANIRSAGWRKFL